ncbi:kinetochore-associated protein KNL-2 homolog [Magnolia sinica]|uniref:kinetochore-associated protein KNL-2 homolog n=1 Tax=Magnolia sinica TaxID=86752 RepID=UPI00265A3078|nr:kinetochore-associated protein KNL-2 homolog [Magnolia sinica]
MEKNDLSSATPADRTAHPSSNPVLKTPASSSFQKVVCLGDWWLVKTESNCGGKRLAVGGLTMKWQQAARVFLSSPIVKRHDAFTLETADGVTVMIQGLINRSRTHQNGFPPEACNKFLTGFPYNWEVYVNQYFGEEPTTQNIPASASCFAEQQRSSVNDACSVARRYFDEIPMSGILEYLISTHGNSDKGKISSLFAEILENCTGDASKNPMMQNDSHIEISTSRMGASSLKETSSMTETTKSHPKHDNSTATGFVAPVDDDYGDYVSNFAEEREGKNDKDTKNGGPETSRKVLSLEELGNINHGSRAELKNDVLSRSALMENSESTSTDAPEQVNQVQTGVDVRNTIPYEKLHIRKESPSKVELRRSSHRLKYLKNNLKGGQTTEGSAGIEKTVAHTISLPAVSNVDMKNGGPEESRKALSSEELGNINHGSCAELKNDVLSRSALMENSESPGNDAPEQVNQVQTGVDVRNTIPYEKLHICKESPSKVELRRSSHRLKYLKNNLKEGQTTEGSAGIEKNVAHTISMSAVSNVDTKNGEPEESRKALSSEELGNINHGSCAEPKNDVLSRSAVMEISESPGNDAPEEVNQVQTGVDARNTIPYEKLHIYKESPSNVELRRSSHRLKYLKNNLKGGQTTKGSAGIEKNVAHTISLPAVSNVGPELREDFFTIEGGDDRHLECAKEPERSFFSGPSGRCSSVAKNVKGLMKSKKNAIPFEEEMDTSNVIPTNADPRRSSTMLNKSMSNLEDLASNVIKTAEHRSHGSSLDVAKDGLEEASNSNISAKVQESNDKAKRRPRKYKKTIVVNQPIITRDRAKKLSIVSPESLNIKRSRSGRLLLPVLANWRNEQPIYDLDGAITGITLDIDRAMPPTGSKSEPAKKRKKHKRVPYVTRDV